MLWAFDCGHFAQGIWPQPFGCERKTQPRQELLALADIVVVRDRNCPADMGIVGIVILPRYETLGGWPWAFGLGNLAVGIWLCI